MDETPKNDILQTTQTIPFSHIVLYQNYTLNPPLFQDKSSANMPFYGPNTRTSSSKSNKITQWKEGRPDILHMVPKVNPKVFF